MMTAVTTEEKSVMAGLTIGAGYVKALMQLAVDKGASEALLTQRSGIASEALLDRDSRIPLDRYQALMVASKALCNAPALGVQLGEAAVFSQISIVGLICSCAATTAEAFAQINRYGRLVVEVNGHRPGGRFEVVPGDGEVWLLDTRQDPNSFPELTESAFAIMINLAREFSDKPFAKKVLFTHADPGDRAEYERILGAPVVFGCDRNAFLMEESLMNLQLSPSDRYVFGVFSERADAMLERLKSASTIRGRVESELIPILHTGVLDMARIAESLGLGRQTLYRKLKAEGTNYEKLVDELRHKMAMHYLSAKKVSLNETAYLTGYSDSTAFSRAYKRWTGTRPGGGAEQRGQTP
ncbi:MAG: AraC-like DNA-binding protein [Candidatus Pseudothioglobus sp.]|jgi:AraC-like DNA-binding protein